MDSLTTLTTLNATRTDAIEICLVLGDLNMRVSDFEFQGEASDEVTLEMFEQKSLHRHSNERILNGLRTGPQTSGVKWHVAHLSEIKGLEWNSMNKAKPVASGFDVVIAMNAFSSHRVEVATTAMERMLVNGGALLVLNNSKFIQGPKEETCLGLSEEALFLQNIKALTARQGFVLEMETLIKADEDCDWGSLGALGSVEIRSHFLKVAPDATSIFNLLYESSRPLGVEASPTLLLSWTLRHKGRDSLGYLKSQDLLGYEALFKECFKIDPTPGLWDYKFGEERGFSLGLYRQLESSNTPTLIAHYAGLKRDILFFGKPAVAIQVGDVMVDIRHIRSLSRKGPFFFIASTFLEHHIGYGRGALLGFGFPNEKHFTIAKHLGFYDEVDRFVEVSWRAKAGRLPFWYKTVELNLENFSQYRFQIDRLWEVMGEQLKASIVGVRDSQYIKRRFFERPGKTYRLTLIFNSITQRAMGLLVFNSEVQRLECMDLVADPRDISTLVAIARQMANSTVQQIFSFRITQGALPWFQSTGFELKDLSIPIPANTWTLGPGVEELQSKWWLSSGDMDFV